MRKLTILLTIILCLCASAAWGFSDNPYTDSDKNTVGTFNFSSLADGEFLQYDSTASEFQNTGSFSDMKVVIGDELSGGSAGTSGLLGLDATAEIIEADTSTEVLTFTPTGNIPDAIEFVIDGGGSAITTGGNSSITNN